MKLPFEVGELVRPGPDAPPANNVPSGAVRQIVPWGRTHAVYVGDDPRAFTAECFEKQPPGFDGDQDEVQFIAPEENPDAV